MISSTSAQPALLRSTRTRIVHLTTILILLTSFVTVPAYAAGTPPVLTVAATTTYGAGTAPVMRQPRRSATTIRKRWMASASIWTPTLLLRRTVWASAGKGLPPVARLAV